MKPRPLLLPSWAVAVLVLASGPASESTADPPPPDARPNILIIMADDCTYCDLPVYGGRNAWTPHLDRLAREGLVFERAYVTSAMCQPCRSELFTGLYPMRNGCLWNHSACYPDLRSMPHYLGELGYRVGLAGKVHVAPAHVFPFRSVDGFDSNCVRAPTRPYRLEGVRQFMTENPSQPFCLVVALVEPHVPWVMGDQDRYEPAELELPPYLADTRRTREDFARYLAEITYMDAQVGALLDLLQELKLDRNTLVLFTSEQGAQFPGCKWTNWDVGVHTAWIARWPGHVPAGKRTAAMVQYVDVLPTLVELAGGQVKPGSMDGASFLRVLVGQQHQHRKYVFAMHNNVPEGPPYPIRSVFDGRYRYIRNLLPERIYIEKHLMGLAGEGQLNNPYWGTWVFESWNQPRIDRLVQRYIRRSAEELYDTRDDPWEMRNRADEEALRPVRQRLASALEQWMQQQGDPGAAVDRLPAWQAARQGSHPFRVATPQRNPDR